MTEHKPPPEAGSPGPSGDRYGVPVSDPTKNVLDLVSAAIQRQDDLRGLESQHLRELANLRAQYDERLRGAEKTLNINAVIAAISVLLAATIVYATFHK